MVEFKSRGSVCLSPILHNRCKFNTGIYEVFLVIETYKRYFMLNELFAQLFR